jgi:hypothetical protein
MKMEAHPIFIVEFLACFKNAKVLQVSPYTGYLPTSLALGASNTGV